MRYPTKTFIILLLSVLLIFFAKKSSAQYPGMRQVYANINMQSINWQRQMQLIGNVGLRGGDYILNNKYTFKVTLKDSSTKLVDSKIYTDTIHHKNYLLLLNKKFPKSDSAHRNQKIYPDQTLNISRIDYADRVIKGNSNDSCWMFKVISGPISAYSFVSEQKGYNSSSLSLIGLQLSNGPVINFSKDNLRLMVGQDLDAIINIGEGNYVKAIKKHNRHVEKAAKK